jgi:hypothetical protein
MTMSGYQTPVTFAKCVVPPECDSREWDDVDGVMGCTLCGHEIPRSDDDISIENDNDNNGNNGDEGEQQRVQFWTREFMLLPDTPTNIPGSDKRYGDNIDDRYAKRMRDRAANAVTNRVDKCNLSLYLILLCPRVALMYFILIFMLHTQCTYTDTLMRARTHTIPQITRIAVAEVVVFYMHHQRCRQRHQHRSC